MSVQTPDRVDPITFEVIRNALLEATEEMTIALRVVHTQPYQDPCGLFPAPFSTASCGWWCNRSVSPPTWDP